MPTIAEIIAAKKAQSAASNQPGAAEQPVKKPLTPGLTLSASDEPDEQLPKSLEPQRRSLSMTSGEAIKVTLSNATRDVLQWHSALQGFESELCLMHDPDPTQERGWLAVRRADRIDEPILLFPLPLFPHPNPIRPPGEPF